MAPGKSKKQMAYNKRLTTTTSAAEILAIYAEGGKEFNEINLSTAIHRFSKNGGESLCSDPRLATMLDQAAKQVTADGWNSRALSNVCWAVAKMKMRNQSVLFEAIAAEVEQQAREFSTQDLANTAWAFATAGEKSPTLFAALAVEAEKQVGRFNPQDIANTTWAFATAGASAPKLFMAIAAEAEKQVRFFKPQNLTNTAWAFATASVSSPKLFAAIAAESEKQMRYFIPQDLANTSWAFATAGVSQPKSLFKAIAAEAERLILRFNPQDLANTAWAFATAGISTPKSMFVAIATEAEKQVRRFNAQDLANTVWAFATAGISAPKLFEAIAMEAEKQQQMKDFTPQELANTSWAFAQAGVSSPKLFAAIAAETERQVQLFKPQELASVVWAYATAQISSPPLFKAVAAEAEKQVLRFNPQDLANVAWSFATVGIQAPELFKAIAAEAVKQMRLFKPQNLANTAWAYAASGFVAPALFEAIASALPSLLKDSNMWDRSQIYLFLLFLRLEKVPQLKSAPSLSAEVVSELRQAFLGLGQSPSRTQGEVSQALKRVGWDHEYEHVMAEGLSLDMAQPLSKVAVEFDGPSHYLADVRGFVAGPNGSSLLKRRMLKVLGWRVMHLPYYEWDRIKGSAAQSAYLTPRLKELKGDDVVVDDGTATPPPMMSRVGETDVEVDEWTTVTVKKGRKGRR